MARLEHPRHRQPRGRRPPSVARAPRRADTARSPRYERAGGSLCPPPTMRGPRQMAVPHRKSRPAKSLPAALARDSVAPNSPRPAYQSKKTRSVAPATKTSSSPPLPPASPPRGEVTRSLGYRNPQTRASAWFTPKRTEQTISLLDAFFKANSAVAHNVARRCASRFSARVRYRLPHVSTILWHTPERRFILLQHRATHKRHDALTHP